jgi:hypothetical protein
MSQATTAPKKISNFMAQIVDLASTLNDIQAPNPSKRERESMKYREDMVKKFTECPENLSDCLWMPPISWSPSLFFLASPR